MTKQQQEKTFYCFIKTSPARDATQLANILNRILKPDFHFYTKEVQDYLSYIPSDDMIEYHYNTDTFLYCYDRHAVEITADKLIELIYYDIRDMYTLNPVYENYVSLCAIASRVESKNLLAFYRG